MSTGISSILHTAMLIVAHRPVALPWGQLTTGLPLQYTPTASKTTLRITLKSNNARILSEKGIYTLTFLSLAEIASSATSTNGLEYVEPRSQKKPTFAASILSPHIQFMITATGDLPVYIVTDVLRAIQELTHYAYLLEIVFEVFRDTDPTSVPIASGCLAIDCGLQRGILLSRDLEYANFSATNLTAAPSRRILTSLAPVSLVLPHEVESVAVAYDHLMNSLPIPDQSFADVADRILANTTNLIIANRGDGPLPFYENTQRRLFHYVDTWGSSFGISLLQVNAPGVGFTLDQAVMALKATQDKMGYGSMMESRLKFTVDGTMVGWGCLRYTNTSTFRCIMPTYWTSASVGSRKYRCFLDVSQDTDTSIESISDAASPMFDVNDAA